MIEIKQMFTTNNKCYTNNKKIAVKGIMLHSVGVAQPKAMAFFNSFNKPTVQKAVHAFLQPDGFVLQTLPWDMKAWHCGGTCNSTHIGIEMTEPSTIKYTGGATWTDLNPEATKQHVAGTYNVAVELFAQLCKQFNLDPRKDGVILSHSEGHKRGLASGHADVEHIWNKLGYSMDQFRRDIYSKMTDGQYNKPSVQPTPASDGGTGYNNIYLGVVNVEKGDTLNVRNKPNGDTISKLSPGFIVAIVGSSGKWLKLDNNAGWVYSDYIKRFNNGFTHSIKKQTVTVKVESLNIRKTPENKSGNVVGSVRKNQTFTIVANCNGFGLLYSGAGYISISDQHVFVKK